jgi:DNA-binding MarR family transcriptional regulator
MQPSAPHLAAALGAAGLLSQVGREHSTVLDRRFSEFGLTTQQAALLLHAGREPASPSKLAEILGTDTAGMTRLLDRLEAKGLLRRQRHTGDRRAIRIELTDQGRALLPRLPPIFGQITGQLFAGFTGDEIEVLSAMCHRMLTNLRAGNR